MVLRSENKNNWFTQAIVNNKFKLYHGGGRELKKKIRGSDKTMVNS